jgi:competence protein ComEA
MKLEKNKIIIIVIIIISILCFGIEKIVSNDKDEEVIQSDEFFQEVQESESKENQNSLESEEEVFDNEDGSSEEAMEETLEEIINNKIYVYVTGEVNNRGVVVLREGARIADAIDASGGITDKANISKINLVYVLQDGMKVNIPNDSDLKNNPDFKYVTLGSGDNDVSSQNIENNTNSENATSTSSSDNKKGNTIVNINSASQTELETLPGIGPSLALKIITYRKENGKFSSIEDIKNVSGIGESKFNELKKYITV